MFYGFATLFFVFSLVTFIPAIIRLGQMQKINRNSSSTFGMIRSTGQSLGWLLVGEVGRADRPIAAFQSQDGKEILIDVIDNRGFLARRYEAGNTVEIIYDKDNPWKAYVKREWQITKTDLLKSGIEIVLAILFWSIGASLGMPL